MQQDFWDFFHDGTVSQLRGDIPGEVVIFIEIPYLRAMFPNQGIGFEVSLTQCIHIEYQDWDGEPVTTFEGILSKEPEIVNVQSTQPLVLNCVTGTLKLSYSEAAISTDSGQWLSYAELGAGSEKYWEAWKRKWQESRGA